MKKTKSFILIITTAILFYNCESNTEDLTMEPIGESQEDSVLNRNLSFEEVYAFEDDLLGGLILG